MPTLLILPAQNIAWLQKNEAMGMTTVLNTAGVNKTQFLEYVAKKPATYADWSRVWSQVGCSKDIVYSIW